MDTHTAVVCGAGRLYTVDGEEGSSGSSYSSLVFDRFPMKQMARDGDNTLSSYNQHGNHPINGPGTEKPIQRMFFEVADPYFRHVRMPLTCDGLMSVLDAARRSYGKLSGQGNAGSDMDGDPRKAPDISSVSGMRTCSYHLPEFRPHALVVGRQQPRPA